MYVRIYLLVLTQSTVDVFLTRCHCVYVETGGAMKRSMIPMIPMIPEPEPMPSKSNAMFVRIDQHSLVIADVDCHLSDRCRAL